MYSGVISKFSDALVKRQTPTIFGDGLQTRDFVYVKDVARANVLAAHAPNVGKGEIINIATGRSTSLLELLDVLSGITGVETEVDFAPERSGDVRHSRADISRAKALLGYEPATDLQQGLKTLVEGIALTG
jgi:nucleoside-diphosphate-sugar epimerase